MLWLVIMGAKTKPFDRPAPDRGSRNTEPGAVPVPALCFSTHEEVAKPSRLRRRVKSVELRVAVKQCEVGILAGPYRIAVTRLPRFLDRDQRVANIVHPAVD